MHAAQDRPSTPEGYRKLVTRLVEVVAQAQDCSNQASFFPSVLQTGASCGKPKLEEGFTSPVPLKLMNRNQNPTAASFCIGPLPEQLSDDWYQMVSSTYTAADPRPSPYC